MISKSGIINAVPYAVLANLLCVLTCVGEDTTKEGTGASETASPSDSAAIKEELKNYGVFYSLDSIRDYLKTKWKDSSDAKKLMYDYDRYCDFRPTGKNKNFPFRGVVSIESYEHAMNDSGKYKVGSMLSQLTFGKLIMGPARCMRHLRMPMRDVGGAIQNAYYALANYGLIKELEPFFHSRYIIVTRYWHSTAAYGIAQAMEDGLVIPHDSDVYDWPSDLFQPNFTFFYDVTNTTEEPETFDGRLKLVYHLLRNPSLYRVEAQDDMTVAAGIKKVMEKNLGSTYDVGTTLSPRALHELFQNMKPRKKQQMPHKHKG